MPNKMTVILSMGSAAIGLLSGVIFTAFYSQEKEVTRLKNELAGLKKEEDRQNLEFEELNQSLNILLKQSYELETEQKDSPNQKQDLRSQTFSDNPTHYLGTLSFFNSDSIEEVNSKLEIVSQTVAALTSTQDVIEQKQCLNLKK